MKTIKSALVFLFLLVSFASYSQACTIPNGSFEDWTDVTEDFAEDFSDEDLPPGTIMLPDNYFGLFRFFTIIFSDILVGVFGGELVETISNIFGLFQSEDASDGNFSLQIQPDADIPFADIFASFECGGELPASFCFDLKHVGGNTDTLFVIGTFGEETDANLDENSFQNSSGYFVIDSMVVDGDSEWTTVSIPITDNMNGVSPDTATISIVVLGNQDTLTAGVESYYLIDNLNFKEESILALLMTSFKGVHKEKYNQVTWSLLNEVDMSHYAIERSYGNIYEWETIEELEVKTGEFPSYIYNDWEVYETGIYYYRLKQYDLFGNFNFSQVISIDVEFTNEFSITSYPNPADHQLNLDVFLSGDAGQMSFQLFSIDGNQFHLNPEFPKELNVGYHNLTFDISDIPGGIYTLIVGSRFNEVRERIVIAK